MPVRWATPLILATALSLATFTPQLPASAATTLELGIFEPGSPWNTSLITNLENTVGVKFQVAKWYQDWGQSFDTSVPPRLRAAGYLPELTWQPMINGAGVSYASVANGDFDAYLTQMAQDVKSVSGTVRISFAAEMNGDWSPYYVGSNGGPAAFQNAWRHVVDVFRSQGATNIEWVWAPNVHYWGEAYSYASLYPGDAYVTYVGLDGYNWGTGVSWGAWQSVSQVFDGSYNSLVALTNKQILIMETASGELGGSKAAWITDLFTTLPSKYPRIKGFTWFNQNKELDWRITSSQAASTAFHNGYVGTTATASPTPTPTPTPSATASSTPKPSPTVTPTPTPTATTSATPTPSVTPSPTSTTTTTPTPTSTAKTTKKGRTGKRTVSLGISEVVREVKPQDQLAIMIILETLFVLLFSVLAMKRRKQATEGAEPLTNLEVR